MQGGAYLIIEHTEAMHVIDVNSGNRTNSQINQEDNALQVNVEAAREIARQLRLRDMGGIIVIDFIDMHKRSEVHTSELQSLMRISYAVSCLKKKKKHGQNESEHIS